MSLMNDIAKLSGVYDQDVPEYGDLMTREEWLNAVETGFFIDYDGMGSPVKDGKMMSGWVFPSQADMLPEDATHVVWFNK